ncbi:hypothetical protein [Roseibium litorale]|uniref:PLL-like beta propeller domain-containing protein n=1 Tax=Roseibium litorale TaxID=2803841 RepID=A0ABR9CI16_9HYPH|nr:hypothetical protein [Roseibium litorale]MBD8890368.1 hypothetical protein [Roseibium litorale]
MRQFSLVGRLVLKAVLFIAAFFPAQADTAFALDFKPLGGISTSRPSVVVWGNGYSQRVAIFVRGQDNALWWQAGNGAGEWYGWARIGGALNGAPSCTNNGLGSVVCMVRWADDSLAYATYDIKSGIWSGFTNVSGKLISDPEVIHAKTESGAVLLAYALGLDNRLWEWRASRSWRVTDENRYFSSGPSCLRGLNVLDFPCLMKNRDTKAWELLLSPDGAVLHDNEKYPPQYEAVSLAVQDRPALFTASTKPSDFYVFFRNPAGEITAMRHTGPNLWSKLKPLPGKIAFDPGCARFPTGRIWCAIVNSTGAVTALGIDTADLK